MAVSEKQAKRALDYIDELRDVRERFKRSANHSCDTVTIGSFSIGDTTIGRGSSLFDEAKNLFDRATLERAAFIAAWLLDNGFEVPE